MTRLLDTTPMPPRIARLPRNRQGFPIPWFVADLPDGTRDFRIASEEKQINALRFGLCWVCGGKRGAFAAFTIGPMCAVNRISAEPPAHRDCGVYSSVVCPFLSTPGLRRRENGKPDSLVEAAGVAILRNPGVVLVWVTRTFRVFRPQLGARGVLCRLGDPTDLLWFAEGRTATRAEVLASMESGLPALQAACEQDDNPQHSLQVLDGEYRKALALVPADPGAA
jgi:hypothetical protein